MNRTTQLFLVIGVALLFIVTIWQIIAEAKPKTNTSTYSKKELEDTFDTCRMKFVLAKIDPRIAEINCHCFVDSVARKYSKTAFDSISKLSIDKQVLAVRDILEYCAKKAGINLDSLPSARK